MAKIKKFEIWDPKFEVEINKPIGYLLLIKIFFVGIKLFKFNVLGLKYYRLCIPRVKVI